MAKLRFDALLHTILRAAEESDLADQSDETLLGRFLNKRDVAAFHVLLRRHGPMVLEVCRTNLPCNADAEDAFQATFLVFVRCARSIRKTASVASWLHGVAFRTAMKARTAFVARRKHETCVASEGQRAECESDDLPWGEVKALLHEELERLPQRYRAVLVLCYLHGKTQNETAELLGLPKGTLRGRLERARALLRERLSRRGLGPAGMVLAAVYPGIATGVVVPPALESSTACMIADSVVGCARVSASVLVLSKQVMKAMLLSKIKAKLAAVVLLAVCTTIPAAGWFASSEPTGRGASETKPLLQAVPGASYTARRDNPSPPPNPKTQPTASAQYRALLEEYDTATRDFLRELVKLKTKSEQQKFAQEKAPREDDYATRFLAIAEHYPQDAVAVDCLIWVVRNNYGSSSAGTALKRLTADHIQSKKLTALVPMLVDEGSPASEAFLRTALKNSPHKEVQGQACFALAQLIYRQSQNADKLKQQPEWANQLEASFGQDYVKKLAAADSAVLRKEAEALFEKVVANYGDVTVYKGDSAEVVFGKEIGASFRDFKRYKATLGEAAEEILFALRNLAVGQIAPDIVGEDIDGKPFKLSDYRGKVVVVTFWATWCPHCMTMVPAERALVKRLQGKPFVLLGVNGDEDRAAVKEAVKQKEISWRSWWDGDKSGGPIAAKWNIVGWPTIYVLDHKGVIRFKDLRGKELDSAVEKLIEEVATENK